MRLNLPYSNAKTKENWIRFKSCTSGEKFQPSFQVKYLWIGLQSIIHWTTHLTNEGEKIVAFVCHQKWILYYVWVKEDWLLSNHRNCHVTVSFKKTDSEISGFSSNSQAKTTTTTLEMSQTISSIRFRIKLLTTKFRNCKSIEQCF